MCRAPTITPWLPTERGAIDNLRLTEAEVLAPDEGYVQVRVEAAGLNFRDVLNVLGLYPGDPGPVGGDFTSTVQRGFTTRARNTRLVSSCRVRVRIASGEVE